MTPALETEAAVASTSSKPALEVSKYKPKGPQKKQRGPKNHQSKGKGKAHWHRPYLPTRVQDPQIGAYSSRQCLQYGQNSDGIHIKRAVKDELAFSTQIIDEIHSVKSSIDVELEKFDAKLNQTLDMSELTRNDKNYTELYQLTNFRLDSIINTCDSIESKCQIDEMGDISIFNINDQLKIIKNYILEIGENTNQFATHGTESDSER
ncbi:hypothetical protein O181_002401 [Austropuccinia psidii MF-1]|uniref:Uncharacterized protein n=1 Tax=Austropuccinia psidii MF-1 TaxID=1389203 RepID=A0A9Q3GD90_9BASI|nr:hypothetical protein [Austropuccinia psidii MF-1]